MSFSISRLSQNSLYTIPKQATFQNGLNFLNRRVTFFHTKEKGIHNPIKHENKKEEYINAVCYKMSSSDHDGIFIDEKKILLYRNLYYYIRESNFPFNKSYCNDGIVREEAPLNKIKIKSKLFDELMESHREMKVQEEKLMKIGKKFSELELEVWKSFPANPKLAPKEEYFFIPPLLIKN